MVQIQDPGGTSKRVPDAMAVREPFLSSESGENWLRQTLYANVDGENASRHRGFGETGVVHLDPAAIEEFDRRAGHKERVHAFAAERATRDFCDRHLDLAIDAAIRGVAGDARTSPMRRPQISLGVDRGAVRNALDRKSVV